MEAAHAGRGALKNTVECAVGYCHRNGVAFNQSHGKKAPKSKRPKYELAHRSGRNTRRIGSACRRSSQPLVGVIMGSSSDWETMEHVAKTLAELGVPHETHVVSAHRTPDLLFDYASSAEKRGIEVIIAGAGGAAHLPGMTASKTVLPVLGVPVESKTLKGLDSLLSIAQMPGGIPVGTLAIGKAGAINAALLAAAILGAKHPEIREALRKFRAEQTERVLANPDPAAGARTRHSAYSALAGSREKEARVTIGILGGGQLGYMLALAGYPLGLHFRFFDPSPEAPVGRIASRVTAEFSDESALEKFANGLELVTYEFENVPVAAVRFLAERVPVFPPPAALEAAQDRLREKHLFRSWASLQRSLRPSPTAKRWTPR